MQVKQASFQNLNGPLKGTMTNNSSAYINNQRTGSTNALNKNINSNQYGSPSTNVNDYTPISKVLNQVSSFSKLPSNLNQNQRPSIQSFSSPSSDPLFQKTLELNLLKIQNRQLKQQSTKNKQQVDQLRSQLEKKVEMLKKFNQLMKIKYNEIKQIKEQLGQKNQRINELEEMNKQMITFSQGQKIKQQLFLKSKELDDLNFKISNLQHENFRNQVYQMKINNLYDELQDQRQKSKSLWLEGEEKGQKIKQLNEQVDDMIIDKRIKGNFQMLNKLQNIQLLFKSIQSTSSSSSPSKRSSSNTSVHLTAFDQALKVQMSQIQELKSTIETCKQHISQLKSNLISSRKQLQVLRNQMKIEELKSNSQRKKLIMQYRLQIHEKDNEINTQFKKYKTLEQKYKVSLQQIKTKDQFFRQYLVGRTTQIAVQQHIQNVLNQYSQQFQTLIQLRSQNKELQNILSRYEKYEGLK